MMLSKKKFQEKGESIKGEGQKKFQAIEYSTF